MPVLDRDTLYKQIWTVPIVQLALKYGISDVGLAKACRRHQIPRPPRGYWARIQSGQKATRPPLPAISDHRLQEVHFQGATMVSTNPDEGVSPRTPRARIEFVPTLDSPHPLVRQAAEHLAAAKAGSGNVVKSDPRTAVDVRVRPEVVDRALRIWDAFAKTWEKEGGQILLVTFVGNPGTAAAIGEDHLKVHMAETYEPTRGRRSAETACAPPPRLCFVLGDGQLNGIKGTWADTKTITLEKSVRPLIDAIRRYLEAQRQIRQDKECEIRQEDRALAVRRARANQIRDEFYLRQEIMEEVNRWEQAQKIRSYLAVLEQRITDGAITPVNAEGFRAWMEWAHWFADDMDPLVTAPARQVQPIVPKKTSTTDLDLTSRARVLVTQLDVKDTDELLLVPEDEIRKLSGWTSGMWRELTLVLEGLGYDVGRRKSSYYW
jgi:hypothetical protein